MGCQHVIRYDQLDFAAEVKRLTDQAGVDVIYDSVGLNTFEKGLSCLKPRGLMCLFGQSSGPVSPLDPQQLRSYGSLFLTRPSLTHYLDCLDGEIGLARSIFDAVLASQIVVPHTVSQSLESIPVALVRLGARQSQVKAVIQIE